MSQRVLVIDDVEAIHSLVKIRLKDEGIDWLSAFDADSGVDLAAQEQPDLILLDVDMPGRDGFTACAALKANPRTIGIPVIFLTASASAEQRVRGLELGALDYVNKPFDSSELRARVRGALRLKYMMDLLAHKAAVDGLTGLWNRVHFDQRLASEMSLSRRNATQLSCIMVDVDHFKLVNDNYGHPFGDFVLRRVAEILMQMCRGEDICCRYGGEEFAVLCPNTAADGAAGLAERMREAIEAEIFECRNTVVRVSCSFGVAEVSGRTDPTLVELADNALYQAKEGGRNRVAVASVAEVAIAGA
jgi:diguanylate cyclase (GGDEF)-like protein